MRRPRYPGRNPRAFHLKYKELQPERYAGEVDKVLRAGKTPAGMHRSILLEEVLRVLAPRPGEIAVDCTLGYGGHARGLLERLVPGGRLLGLDVDPVELPRTAARLRTAGFPADVFLTDRTNFAGLPQAMARHGLAAADVVLADLGVSSMQIDDPDRGFTFKVEAPLDMRLNPRQGAPASERLARATPAVVAGWLRDFADEPLAEPIAAAVAGRVFATSTAFADALRAVVRHDAPRADDAATARTVRRVFQAVRIAVNDELGALDALLRHLPSCLAPGGRVAVLTFHSGEDRRVKKAFQAGVRDGLYEAVNDDVIRASAAEVIANPRAASAKLRWARRATP
jgi:16S rRNA (cytosine1402-N4)-methyltransferase